jgi:hypothetical protein
MALQYVSSDEKDFSGGIDARSSENQIAPSFVKELLNADVVEKRVRKRPGYQGFAGNVPVRVTKLDYKSVGNQICFTLDSAISLSSTVVDLGLVGTSPLVVYGRTSSSATGTGPFNKNSDTCKWYSQFTVLTKKTFLESDAPITILSDEHGIATTSIFTQAVQLQPNVNNRSYETTIPNEIKVNQSSYNITIDYTNSTGADIPVYVYYKDRSALAGESYVTTLNHTGSGLENWTINATGVGAHNLKNFNIISQLQVLDGTEWKTVKPESFSINLNGSVTIQINSYNPQTYHLILSACEIENQGTGNVAGQDTHSLSLLDLTSPWIFYGIYLEENDVKKLVYPNSISYDDSTKSATIQFTNGESESKKFSVFYQYGYLRSNQLCVQDAGVTLSGVDNRPQITLWGLDHNSIYGETPAGRAGWVTHIDSYTSAGEQRMLCGLGGNLFANYSASEKGGSYNYAQLYPRLQARTSGARVLAPLFWDSGELPKRTRGYITSSSSGTHWAKVSAVKYDTDSPHAGYTKYTLSLPDMAIVNSSGVPTAVGNVISVASNLEDHLTVQNMSYKRHNGTFRIVDVASGSNEIYVWVDNEDNSADYDDGNTNGEAGVFTDQIQTLATSPFLAGDQLYNAALDESVYQVTSSSGTTTVINGVVDIAEVSSGLITIGVRTSSVVPLRSSAPTYTASTTNLVQGDMLSYTGTLDERKIRVLSINAGPDLAVTINGNGTTATATTVSSTSYLVAGRKIVIYSAGVYSGVHTIESVTGTTSFTFASSSTETGVTGTVAGNTMEIDEELTWQDSENDADVFAVTERWLPVEAPDDQYSATPNTYVRHFDTLDYGVQPFLRSTTVVNNMYLTNYQDEVMKFDGTNIYRAGLFPWQPGLFLTQDTTLSSKIVNTSKAIIWKDGILPTDRAAGRLPIEASELKAIPVGSPVKLQGSSTTYTVTDYNTETGTHYILFDRSLEDSITATDGTITQIFTRRYYFRLDAVDANNNIIASAMTGYQDHVIELVSSAAVHIKLVGLPVWDVYDYDRLYVNIYAAKNNTAGPFFKVASVPIQWENTQGYINYVDSISDYSLVEDDGLGVLTGGEIGLAWQEPLRSKYITSIGNRLVQANLKDYPQLDIQIEAAGNITNTQYNGKIFTFKKDSAKSLISSTRMVDYASYEYVNGFTGNIKQLTHSSGTTFTCTASGSLAGKAQGNWVYLTFSDTNSFPNYHTFPSTAVGADISITGHGYTNGQQVKFSTIGTSILPSPLSPTQTYYVVEAAANNFKVSLSLGGSALSLGAATGTNSVALAGNDPTFSGWWQIYSVDTTGGVGSHTFTINYTGADPIGTSHPDRYVFAASDPLNVPVLLGTDGSMGMTNGTSVVSNTFDAGRRLAMAINSSMRMVDTSITAQSTFKAWMVARGGNDVGQAGRVIVRQPQSNSAKPSVILPSSFGTAPNKFSIFVNNIGKDPSSEIQAAVRLYPSRLTLSYEKYPEIVDSPTSILDIESQSAIDVNSADGQEITGIIPFFGETAFTAAQQEAVLVVFKTNSIYLVDVAKKAAGEPCLQKIETEGLGCTAPYSIARTKKGVIFANESGIYCLRRDQSIQYLGRYMERNWVDRVNRDLLELCQGHHYGVGRSYKLSVPLLGETACSEVYVYNHTGEDYGQNQLGAWGRYDNHPATGWANLAADAFFGATHGRVYSIRRQGTETDFRDDNMPIAFQLDTRALDFGNSGIRKVLDSILIDYRVPVESTGTAVLYAADTQQEYRDSTLFTIQKSANNTGLDDQINRDIQTIRHDTDRRRGNYFQVRVTNSSLDEGLEIAGMSFRVGGLTDKGTKQARQTRK